jgi:hypothetical protein
MRYAMIAMLFEELLRCVFIYCQDQFVCMCLLADNVLVDVETSMSVSDGYLLVYIEVFPIKMDVFMQ